MQGEKFNQFIDENRSPVCRWIIQRFHLSEDDAKDIYQESSIALYHKIDTELSSSLERFFAGIWYRQTMKFLRKRRREVPLDLTDSGMNPENRTGVSLRKVNELLEKAESCPPPPDEVIDQERMREAVTKALDEMAERCRTGCAQAVPQGSCACALERPAPACEVPQAWHDNGRTCKCIHGDREGLPPYSHAHLVRPRDGGLGRASRQGRRVGYHGEGLRLPVCGRCSPWGRLHLVLDLVLDSHNKIKGNS